MVEKALQGDDFSAERVAWMLAEISVGNVRNMFWDEAEFARAFRLERRTVHRWAKENEIPGVQFTKGGRWFFSKVGIFRALQDQLSGDGDEFPAIVLGTSFIERMLSASEVK